MGFGALALVIEKRRRALLLTDVRKALHELFEVVPRDRTARASASAVYQAVAERMKLPAVGNGLRIAVRRTVREMGGGEIQPLGRSWFVFFRARPVKPAEVMPRRKLTNVELGKLRRKWYARAQAGDAFDDIEKANGDLKRGWGAAARGAEQWLTRADLDGAYFQRRKDAYWRLRDALDVWALYVVECLPIRDIEERTGMGRDRVHRTIKMFERWMTAGQPGLFKETSSDEIDIGREDEIGGEPAALGNQRGL